jgi:hypothetical protein
MVTENISLEALEDGRVRVFNIHKETLGHIKKEREPAPIFTLGKTTVGPYIRYVYCPLAVPYTQDEMRAIADTLLVMNSKKEVAMKNIKSLLIEIDNRL